MRTRAASDAAGARGRTPERAKGDRPAPERTIVWSDAALALFALSAPTAVSAGAGSGKTTCLVELCVKLLSGEATGTPCDPAAIVAITFTEKAAAELEERLRAAVAARAAQAPAGSGEARAWSLRLHGLDAMAVGTIHGFARRVLREHALEAGVDPDAEIVDEQAATARRLEAARAAVLAALDAGRPETQRLVAAYGVGGRKPGLVEALAGVMRERAGLGDTAPPAERPDPTGEALALRSSLLAAADALLRAAAEVATASGKRAMERLREAVTPFRESPSPALSPRGGERGRLSGAELAAADAIAAVLRGWRAGKSDSGRARALKAELAEACEKLVPVAAEALALPQLREVSLLLAVAEERHRAAKRRDRVLDFDDLLVGMRDLLRASGGPRHELRRRFRAVLVDEYQDVNRVQQEILDLLTGEEDGAPRPLLVAVGDLKQSIYRFRGADVSVFRGVVERFGGSEIGPRPAVAPAPEGLPVASGEPRSGRVLHLVENHRSSPGVLELVNTVFSRCMQPSAGAPREYELAFRDGDRLIARRPPGQVPCCELLVDDAPAPGEERRAREAAALARRIRALVSGAAGVEVRERAPDGDREVGRTPRHGDIAMLFRRLTQVGRYERALREAGIPCRLVRGGGFYQAPEVRDLGELLATLADPEDAPAWAALLRSPLCAIRDGSLLAVSRLDLRTLGRRRVEEVVSTVLALGPHARDEASRLEAFLRAWHDARARRDRLDVGALLRAIVARLDLEATHLASPDGERRLLNLRKALALAERAGERGTTPRELAAHLRRMAREPPSEPEAELESGDAVALLSVHQAKGLEWPIVLVPDMGALPPRDGRRVVRDASGALAVSFHDRATDEHRPTRPLLAGREEASRAGAAESRRLLYVALTRARDRLVLSGEGSRGGETWRSLVEAGVADRPELVVRVPIADAGSFAVGPPLSPATATGTAPATATAAATAPATATAAAAADDGVVLAGPPPRSALRLAVTELAEYARCPRRFHLIRRLGLTEPQASPAGVHDDPDRATARGTLAHAMIAESDPAAPPLERRAQLLAAATRRGFDPSSPGVKRILAEVARFLEAPPGRALASAARTGRLRREVPFLLRLGESSGGAGSCYLTGAIDALVESRHELSVVDFKYALARPGVAARYRTQLLAYALAATRARPGRRVTARLQFLRGPCAAVDVTPSAAELGRFAHEAPRLAHEATRPDAAIPSPSELGRAEAQCTRERCGFVARCFRRDG